MRFILTILLSTFCTAQSVIAIHEGKTVTLHEGETLTLPEAPEPQPRKTRFWSYGSPDAPTPLRTNREVFRDKTWALTQAFWAGAIIYDEEVTHQGLAHHRCAEQTVNPPHPSRGDLYRSAIPEYAVGTLINWMVLKYVSKPLIFEFPAYSGTKHVLGGSSWLENCW